jgi:hypothetical protein
LAKPPPRSRTSSNKCARPALRRSGSGSRLLCPRRGHPTGTARAALGGMRSPERSSRRPACSGVAGPVSSGRPPRFVIWATHLDSRTNPTIWECARSAGGTRPNRKTGPLPHCHPATPARAGHWGKDGHLSWRYFDPERKTFRLLPADHFEPLPVAGTRR